MWVCVDTGFGTRGCQGGQQQKQRRVGSMSGVQVLRDSLSQSIGECVWDSGQVVWFCTGWKNLCTYVLPSIHETVQGLQHWLAGGVFLHSGQLEPVSQKKGSVQKGECPCCVIFLLLLKWLDASSQRQCLQVGRYNGNILACCLRCSPGLERSM